MISVSSEYQSAVASKTQRWIPSMTIDYSDFNIDNSIQSVVSDRDITSDDAQIADGKELPTYRWAYWDSFQWGDHFRSEASTGNEKGAVSETLSDNSGNFNKFAGALAGYSGMAGYAMAASPISYPEFCITFSPRTVQDVKAIFEGELGQWAEEFDIVVTESDGTENTTSVTGHSSYRYEASITPVTQAVSVCLVIKKWSESNSKAKVMETFTSLQESYTGAEIISFSILEETSAEKSTSPIGNATSNSFVFRILNLNSRFDNDNLNSVLSGSVTENRRARPYIKNNSADDVLPMGVYYTKDWTIDNNKMYASARCEDVISLMGESDYKTSTFINPGSDIDFDYTTTAEFDTWTLSNIDTSSNEMKPGDGAIYDGNPQPVTFAGFGVAGISALASWPFSSAEAEKNISFTYTPGTSVKVTPTYNGTLPGGASINFYVEGELVENGSAVLKITSNDTTQDFDAKVEFLYSGTKPIVTDMQWTVSESITRYSLAQNVLISYDSVTNLLQGNWDIDNSYADYPIPTAYLPVESYRKSLKRIVYAAGGRMYQNRNGTVVLEGAIMPGTPVKTWNNANSFDIVKPINKGILFNRVTVIVNELVHDTSEEVANINVDIADGTVETYEVEYKIDPTDTITYSGLPGSVTVTDETNYTWGSVIEITNSSGSDQDFQLSILGRPYRVKGQKRITVDDTDSIRRSGVVEFIVDSELIQDESYATALANSLITQFGNQRRTVSMDVLPDPSIVIGDSVYSNDDIYVVQSNEFGFKAGEFTHIVKGFK